jgi:lipopolysaccharide/colanic/teichoic acid biosynthesis glycosyltransferase
MFVPSPTSRSGKRVYLSVWDLFWVLTSPIVALYLRDEHILFRADWTVLGYFWGLSAGFALLALFAFKLQDGMTRYFSVHEALDVAEAVLFAELMTCAVLFTFIPLDGIPRSMPLIHGLLLAAGLLAARIVVRIALSDRDEAQDYQSTRERIIIIGANRLAASFIQLLRAVSPQQQPVIGVLDDATAMIGRAVSGIQVLGAPHELDSVITEFAIHGVNTDRVVIAGEADFLDPAVLHELERVCKKRQVKLAFLPRMIGVTEWRPVTETAGREPVRPAPAIALPAYFWLKRWIDVFGSLSLLVLLSPVLLISGLLVLLDTGSPILFWQQRVGWKGRSFLIYKFRTLGVPFDADGNPLLTGRQPSAIGRFLRASRIDELPQLLNVLLGDMALIGPRPLLPEDQPANTLIRLAVRPGISGWAQINGAKLVSKEDKEKLDEWYVRNASLWLDLRIALMTVLVMLSNRMSSVEAAADAQQARNRDLDFERSIVAVRRVPAE